MDRAFVRSHENFEFTTLKEIIVQLLQNTGYLVDANTTGIATGFDTIDTITKGFQAGELSVVASKPGSGKTAFLLSLLFNIASKSGKTAGVFSLERSAAQMFHRMITSETQQSVQKITAGDIKDSDKETINTILYTLSKSEIYVDDTPHLTENDFHKRCKQLKNKYGADIIFIDGLELLSFPELGDIDDDTKEPHYVLNDIKKTAKEINLPVVVFSHMSNTTSLNTDAAPSIHNVYDFVPQTADSIYLIHRQNPDDKASVIIAQHPNIQEPVLVPLKFIESIDKFVDF
ncbi:MAG: DnaB-like helicase C-terminal domain-containing protein [Bacteroidales bacterium]|jgi:replicative DNA helicase|nr:DnaB-like helicase C-terminal domain-containing protein [Bacteroidales bacterium]